MLAIMLIMTMKSHESIRETRFAWNDCFLRMDETSFSLDSSDKRAELGLGWERLQRHWKAWKEIKGQIIVCLLLACLSYSQTWTLSVSKQKGHENGKNTVLHKRIKSSKEILIFKSFKRKTSVLLLHASNKRDTQWLESDMLDVLRGSFSTNNSSLSTSPSLPFVTTVQPCLEQTPVLHAMQGRQESKP